MELMVDEFNGGEGIQEEKPERGRRGEGQGRKKGPKAKNAVPGATLAGMIGEGTSGAMKD